jgi:hypothetical protein
MKSRLREIAKTPNDQITTYRYELRPVFLPLLYRCGLFSPCPNMKNGIGKLTFKSLMLYRY